MFSRRLLISELLAGVLLVTSGNFAMAESGSGSGGSGSSNSGSGNNNHDGKNNDRDDNDDDDENENDDNEQDDARHAVVRGDAATLRDILRKVKKQYSGEVVHVGLKKNSQRLVYMIKLIDPAGKLLLLRVDAKSGIIFGEHGS
jgi:hypothetical protein